MTKTGHFKICEICSQEKITQNDSNQLSMKRCECTVLSRSSNGPRSVCITSCYPKFNGSHFALPSSSGMTRLGRHFVSTMTHSHRPHLRMVETPFITMDTDLVTVEPNVELKHTGRSPFDLCHRRTTFLSDNLRSANKEDDGGNCMPEQDRNTTHSQGQRNHTKNKAQRRNNSTSTVKLQTMTLKKTIKNKKNERERAFFQMHELGDQSFEDCCDTYLDAECE